MRCLGPILACLVAVVFGTQNKTKVDPQPILLPARPTAPYEFTSGVFRDEESPVLRRAIPYRHIELQQWGPPDLIKLEGGLNRKITLRRDGKAKYEGISGDTRIGTYTGEIDLRSYARLCVLFDAMKISDNPIGIEVRVSHPAISQLTLQTDKADKPLVMRNDHNFGDYRFWVVESLIKQIASEIEWKEQPDR